MEWTDFAAQFCYVLGFGVLLGLAYVPPAPVGKPFYRMMACTAALSLAVGALVPPLTKALPWDEPSVLCGCLATVATLSCARQALGPSWWAGFGLSISTAGTATALTIERCLGLGLFGISTTTALATGAVAGCVGLAMVLGHWYLTVPKLNISHLVRLNNVCIWVMVVSLSLIVVTCLVYLEDLNAASRPLFGTWGLFFLGTRLVVGLLLPLIFAWMVRSSLRLGNTRSATGILYASTVLVLIGTAISISLQEAYRVPL